MEGNMRATHLKLDPIDTQSFVNPTGPPGMNTVTSSNDSKSINASMLFNKGMLSPIDPGKLPSHINGNQQ